MAPKDKFVVWIAALLCTVADSGEDGAPDGICYTALTADGCSLADYQMVRGSILRAGWITLQNHILTITVKGKEKAAEIDKTTQAH